MKTNKIIEDYLPEHKYPSNQFIGEVFIDPTCDVGFKKLMNDNEILIDFLNTFLPEGTPQIVSATLQPTERLGDKIDDKRVIFDVRAKDSNGKIYIIEVQRGKQDYFVKRSIYYNCREVSLQGGQGGLMEYDFEPVYNISVLNFIPDAPWAKSYYNHFTLKRTDTNEELTDAISHIFIILKLMNLKADELKDRRTQWCYLLRHAVKIKKEQLATLKWTDDHIFEKMKTLLHTETLTEKERRMLDEIQKVELDWASSISEATRKGTEKGFEEGKAFGFERGDAHGFERGNEHGIKIGIDKGSKKATLAIALELLQNGCEIQMISKCTKLSVEELKKLKDSL